MQISSTREISPQIDNPQAINLLIDAMRADFGERFIRQFHEDIHFQQFKRRLRTVLLGYTTNQIVAGYNNAVKTNPSFIPTIPEIEQSCRTVRNAAVKAEREKREMETFKALPSPDLDTDKQSILRQMRDVLKNKI